MTRPMVYEINVQTQEETTREMNDAEFALFESNKIKAEEAGAALAAKAAAKAEALAALGLSQEAINLLAE